MPKQRPVIGRIVHCNLFATTHRISAYLRGENREVQTTSTSIVTC
jgi:hypothetical protein